jgi:peptidoglycan/LPS O-acetylase OafA/YrhL
MEKVNYRADIDGLRGIAILSVVLFHIFPQILPSGFVGVDMFFVLSGFLITQVIEQSISTNSFSIQAFYQKRIKRILPSVLVVVLGVLIVGIQFMLADEHSQLKKHILASLSSLSNLVYLGEIGYFDKTSETKPLLHLWSLSIEEQFYIAYPWLLYLLRRHNNYRISLVFILTIISFFLSVKVTKHHPLEAFYLLQTRAWELLIGGGVYQILPKISHLKKLRQVASPIGFVFLIYAFYFTDPNHFPGYGAIPPVLGTLLIIFSGVESNLNRKIANPFLLKLADISFPLYLWHWPVLSYFTILLGGEISILMKMVIIVISFLLALLTHHYIEQTIRYTKYKYITHLLIFAMCFIAILTYTTNKHITPQVEQLSYTFESNEACKKKHPYAEFSCHLTEKGHKSSTIFMIGDSHMEALSYGFQQLVKDFDFNYTAVGKGGCPPFINTEVFTPTGENYGCKKIISSALNYVSSNRDIKYVILVNRFSTRIDSSFFGSVEKDLATKPWKYVYSDDKINTDNSEQAFLYGLKETLNLLQSKSKKVIIVHQIPELGFDPRNCLTRGGYTPKKSCKIDESIVINRLKKSKNTIHTIASQYPNVIEYDPIRHFCFSGFCSPFNRAGQLMYRDDDHMSKIASLILSKEIIDIVNVLPK